MNIGRLDKRITFFAPTVAKSATGQATTTYAQLAENASVWARVESQGGGEGQEGQLMQGQHTWRINIRPRSDLTTKMRIRYGEKVLYVTSIGEPNRRTDEQEILATESIPTNA